MLSSLWFDRIYIYAHLFSAGVSTRRAWPRQIDWPAANHHRSSPQNVTSHRQRPSILYKQLLMGRFVFFAMSVVSWRSRRITITLYSRMPNAICSLFIHVRTYTLYNTALGLCRAVLECARVICDYTRICGLRVYIRGDGWHVSASSPRANRARAPRRPQECDMMTARHQDSQRRACFKLRIYTTTRHITTRQPPNDLHRKYLDAFCRQIIIMCVCVVCLVRCEFDFEVGKYIIYQLMCLCVNFFVPEPTYITTNVYMLHDTFSGAIQKVNYNNDDFAAHWGTHSTHTIYLYRIGPFGFALSQMQSWWPRFIILCAASS